MQKRQHKATLDLLREQQEDEMERWREESATQKQMVQAIVDKIGPTAAPAAVAGPQAAAPPAAPPAPVAPVAPVAPAAPPAAAAVPPPPAPAAAPPPPPAPVAPPPATAPPVPPAAAPDAAPAPAAPAPAAPAPPPPAAPPEATPKATPGGDKGRGKGGKCPAPAHGAAAPPTPTVRVAAPTYSVADCAAILHWLRMPNGPAQPDAPIETEQRRIQVCNMLNINQWRLKLTRDLGATQMVANGYETRDAAATAAFNLCAFAKGTGTPHEEEETPTFLFARPRPATPE